MADPLRCFNLHDSSFLHFLVDNKIWILDPCSEFLEVLGVKNRESMSPLDYWENLPLEGAGNPLTFLPHVSAGLCYLILNVTAEYRSVRGEMLYPKPVPSNDPIPPGMTTRAELRRKGLEVVKDLLFQKVSNGQGRCEVLLEQVISSLSQWRELYENSSNTRGMGCLWRNFRGWSELPSKQWREAGVEFWQDPFDTNGVGRVWWTPKCDREDPQWDDFNYRLMFSPQFLLRLFLTYPEFSRDLRVQELLFRPLEGKPIILHLLHQIALTEEVSWIAVDSGGENSILPGEQEWEWKRRLKQENKLRRKIKKEIARTAMNSAIALMKCDGGPGREAYALQVYNLLLERVGSGNRPFLNFALESAKRYPKFREKISIALLDFITASNKEKIAIAPEFSQLAATYDFGSGLTPFAIGDRKRSGLFGANWDWSGAVKDLPLSDPVRRKFCQKHSIQTFTWDKEGDPGRPK
jgi:hypothetical protein